MLGSILVKNTCTAINFSKRFNILIWKCILEKIRIILENFNISAFSSKVCLQILLHYIVPFCSAHCRISIFCFLSTEDGRSTSIFLLYGQLSQDQMFNFPAFIASKSFDLLNHYIPQMKWYNLWHILMYQKYMKFEKKKPKNL